MSGRIVSLLPINPDDETICRYCGNPEHEYPHPIVRETVYLPMDCPNCGRHRLEFDGYHVVCEKCGSCDWEYPRREK